MPACPRDNRYSTLPPPGFTDANVSLKREHLIDLLKNIIDKCQHEPSFLAQQSKQTDLLISIAQLTLLSTPISPNDRQGFLNNIVTITQDLLSDENNKEIVSSVDSCPPSNENTVSPSTILPSNATTIDAEGDFSLDDLANEYLQNEPTPSSLNDKPTTPSESDESDLIGNNLSTNYLSSSPSTPITNVLSSFISPALSTEPILIRPPLESILFSNRLSSHDAADDADGIWKEESSPFGQMFCRKIDEIDSTPTKRISTCLLDRSLYERLTRLIILLPKQCIRNSVQQVIIRPNEQFHRPPRSNYDHRRPPNRASFQQNSLRSPHPMPRYPNPQNPRPNSNFNYYNQQGNSNGYFVDRRSQQQQQQNRHPPPFAPYPGDQQYQPRGPPKNNSYNNGYQQPKKNQQTNNQQQQQRGTKKGSGGGGNKSTNEKSGASGSDPNVNPK